MGSACCKPKNILAGSSHNTINVPNNSTPINLELDESQIVLKGVNKEKSPIETSPESNISKLIPRRKNTYSSILSLNVREKLLDEDNKKKNRRITTKKLIVVKEGDIREELNDDTVFDENIPKDQEEFIKEVLNDLHLLNNLDDETIEELILGFFKTKVNEKNIYENGEVANLFYIIDSGCVEINNDVRIINLRAGDHFGIEALEENKTRNESARTTQPTTLLCLTGELYRNAKEYMYLKNLNDKINLIKSISLIKNLDQIKIIGLCQSIIEKEYHNNTIIMTEGYNFDRIYLIYSGNIWVSKNYKKIKKIGKGEYFGDISLITKKPSLYTYSVDSTNAKIYEIPYNAMPEILSESYAKIMIYRQFMASINKSEKINEHLFENIDELFNIFKLKFYISDEVVFTMDNQKNKKICIIISGKLRKQGKSEIIAKSEDLFGELIVESKSNLESNIVSDDLTLTLEAYWVDILKSFKSDTHNKVGFFYETVIKMKKMALFSTLNEIKLFQLAKKLTVETFTNNEEIIRDGTISDKFYIIKTGKVKVYENGKLIREMEEGSCFGEISILPGMVRTITVVSCEQKTECFVLAKDSFNEVIDLALLKHLQKILSLQDIDVELENLHYIKVLGNGRFGKVILVHNKKTFYAIKYANIKSICSRENLIKYYINEKNIMMQVDHPFIVKLVKTMKNKDNIFFLMEFIDGMPLKTYLDKRKKISLKNPYETAFYGSILLCVISYMHKKRILHRDIKPDNCMIDRNGYLKLIDFGVAKLLKEKDYTKTCCGTPHYTAPEVILGKGYSYSSDYWSVGVSMHEIFYGYVPFGINCKDVMDIYNEILNRNLSLPYDPKFNDINNFFKIILSKNLIQRVCNFNLLRSHPFFHEFDFDKLTEFDIKPPFIPDSFIEQNLSGGISLLSHTNIPFNIYIENNAYYDQDIYNEYDELYKKEKAWIAEF